MTIVSVINYKGGVGKTTVTANLAAELAFRGNRVLLIDVDPQASLTFSFVTPEHWQENLATDLTIKNWFTITHSAPPLPFGDLITTPEIVNRRIGSGRGRLDLIASHLELINVDLELATLLGGASLRQAKLNFLKTHRRLVEGLNQLSEDQYSIVLIDCPPNFNIVTKNAIIASDYVLIPAKPDYLSTLGIDYLRRSIEKLIKEYNEFVEVESEETLDEINPQILGVVFTMIQIYGREPISTMRPYIEQTRRLGVPVFDNYLRKNNTMFGDASQYGVPVVLNDFSPNTTYSEVREEFEIFVDEFEGKI